MTYTGVPDRNGCKMHFCCYWLCLFSIYGQLVML